jgi:glycosyltransferase involved in cell wall biosynthesis
MNENPPPIAVLSDPTHRPLVSVMIPTYEPGDYLLKTIASIVNQDFDHGLLQIMVVDDASPTINVSSLITNSGFAARVNVVRNPNNLGLAGNWNECLRLARGELVHILHQDDLVSPGFYQHLSEALVQNPALGMAFSGCAFIDEHGTVIEIARRERRTPGVIRNWIAEISRRYSVHCPAAVVRRSTYEQLGGYRLDLHYALDWEMWVRIAAHMPVWHDPATLACYRRHAANETARLSASKQTHVDELYAISLFAQHLPADQCTKLMSRAYARFADSRIRRAKKLLRLNRIDDAVYQLHGAQMAIARLPNGLQRKGYSLRLTLLRRALK